MLTYAPGSQVSGPPLRSIENPIHDPKGDSPATIMGFTSAQYASYFLHVEGQAWPGVPPCLGNWNTRIAITGNGQRINL
jgi:hypothetical protein